MYKTKNLSSLRHHVSFFRLLRTHPMLYRLNFEQQVRVGAFEYQFCAPDVQLIIEITSDVCTKERYKNARSEGFDFLSYETLVWEEFPEIVIEDMLSFLAARAKSAIAE